MLMSLKLSSQQVAMLGWVFTPKMSCTKMYQEETKQLNYMAMRIPSAMDSYIMNVWIW